MTVVLRNGERFRGRFLRVDGERNLLTLGAEESSLGQRSFTMAEISKIRDRRKHVRPEWMVVGFLGGAVLGSLVDEGDEDDNGPDRSFGAPVPQVSAGAAIGAATGIMLGILIPSLAPTDRWTRCR